jgi:hypothetical protein
MRNLRTIFPGGAKDFFARNPQVETVFTHGTDAESKIPRLPKPRMNKTESEYALILEAMKRKGEIVRYEYEGITLRWADMRYTPDFIVFKEAEHGYSHLETKFIEVKGGHIWDRDIVRFKGARAYWPEFQFEMHQKKRGEWKQIL